MMNIFYHDRITLSLETLEVAVSKLNYGDGKKANAALEEIRSLVDTTYELSKFAEHIWEEQSYVLGPAWQSKEPGVNAATGQSYTYVDQWAARYELLRREIVLKLRAGYSIELVPPDSK